MPDNPLPITPRDLKLEKLIVGGETLIVVSWKNEQRRTALTDAEQYVLALLLEGATNAEIAQKRGTSTRTIANQVAALFAKLSVHSRRELRALR